MIPAMSLQTYLAGWGAVDSDRRHVGQLVMRVCDTFSGAIQHEAAGLLAARLKAAIQDDDVSEIEVDGKTRSGGAQCGRISLSVSRSGNDGVLFAFGASESVAKDSTGYRKMLASGHISIGKQLRVMLNVGKGTHLFVQNEAGGPLRLARSGVDGPAPIAA
jgi:hypothetical protein